MGGHYLRVLSLFDGIASGLVALKRSGIKVDKYYSSEIDSACIEIADKNHPEIIQLGDVKNWREWDLEGIDLIMGGSPCQGFSNAGRGLNFDDPRSELFFEMVDIIEHFKPKYFLLENVVMRPEWEDIITQMLGVIPVEINSSLVSAQTRKRKYWCNWKISQPKDKDICVSSILIKDDGMINPASIKGRRLDPLTNIRDDYNKQLAYTQCVIVGSEKKKMACLTTVSKDTILTKLDTGLHLGAYDALKDEWRTLDPIECERLQTLPDDYTKGHSDNKRYEVLGNGWTVDVISHILKQMNDEEDDWL